MAHFSLYTYFGVFGLYCVQDTYFICILYVFRVFGCIVVDPHVFLCIHVYFHFELKIRT